MMQSEYSHSRNESVTTLNSDLPPLPCVRNQLVLSLDSHFVHVSTFSLISLNLLMALATLLISVFQSRNVIESSIELDMITTALIAFSVFFAAIFTAEVFFRMIMLGSFLAKDPLVISDAIVVVISLALQIYFCIQRDKTFGMAASTLLVFRWPRILSRASFPQSNCRPMPGKVS
ncbi:hypothetical protein DSO57_1033336 [Entomophthora muscae]|uniref:Uncharacterized protein n=1 Tax=Entomophthora muscae TaxID=34485 RepID=A0ACC2RES7_9FUNG|nr:hypothetical protein DSO57_1033336 [Entomophthora muscae]